MLSPIKNIAKKLWHHVVFLLLIASSASATSDPMAKPVMTLDDAVSYALAHSPQIARAESEEKIRRLELENANAARLPSLDLAATHGLSNTLPTLQTERPAPAVSRMSLAVNQSLWDQGAMASRQRVAATHLEIAQLMLAKARDDLALEVTQSFHRLSLADIMLSIRKRQHDLLSKQFALMLAQYQQGLKTKKDFLRLKSETQRALVAVEEGEARKRNAQTELLRLLGRDTNAPP